MNRQPFCVDFDDYCDAVVDTLDVVEALKDEYKALKVTLFAIPKRCSEKTIKKAKKLSRKGANGWLQLAPHGWRHTRGECFAWSDDEAKRKIELAREMGIDAPVFRAPAWLLDGDVYTACKTLGYTVASHADFRVPDTGVKEYVYNMAVNEVVGVHGHLTPVADNCIVDMVRDGRLKFPDNATFVFPQNVAQVVRGGVHARSLP